jgi:topoisomerase-4 subunit B
MPARQLKETTMDPSSRILIRVSIEQAAQAAEFVATDTGIDDLVDRLMGKNAEARFDFIQQNASFVQDIDI